MVIIAKCLYLINTTKVNHKTMKDRKYWMLF